MVSATNSAILWIDSQIARVFEITGDQVHTRVFRREEPEKHINPHTPRAGHYENRFFHAVAGHLSDVQALLVLGPGVVKDQFFHHVQTDHPKLAARILAVESADHPNDAQLLAYARKHFGAHP